MNNLTEYRINAGYRSWDVPHPRPTREDLTIPKRIWTFVVHEPTCAHADARSVAATNIELIPLAQRGFAPPTRSDQGPTWTGCQHCGTGELTNEHWMAAAEAAQNAILAERAAETQRNTEQRKVIAARHAREDAVRAARAAWLAEHRPELDRIEAEALARWATENPERVALLVTR